MLTDLAHVVTVHVVGLVEQRLHIMLLLQVNLIQIKKIRIKVRISIRMQELLSFWRKRKGFTWINVWKTNLSHLKTFVFPNFWVVQRYQKNSEFSADFDNVKKNAKQANQYLCVITICTGTQQSNIENLRMQIRKRWLIHLKKLVLQTFSGTQVPLPYNTRYRVLYGSFFWWIQPCC